MEGPLNGPDVLVATVIGVNEGVIATQNTNKGLLFAREVPI